MKAFRDRLAFDPTQGTYRDGAIRYMMIRPDSLMGILHELPEAMRPEVLAAFARSVTRYGGNSASSYRDAGADLVRSIMETAPALGWGVWDLQIEATGLKLSVRNSPFATGHGPSLVPVCHAIVGMVTAVGSLLHGSPIVMQETLCSATTGGSTCQFATKI